MANLNDVRRLALALPGTETRKDGLGFTVHNGKKERGFAWVWHERVHPKKPRVPNPEVIALRLADLEEKDVLLASDEEKFFTEPHYDGYPAVLVRLRAVTVPQLRNLLTVAWRCQAAPALVARFEARPRRRPLIGR